MLSRFDVSRCCCDDPPHNVTCFVDCIAAEGSPNGATVSTVHISAELLPPTIPFSGEPYFGEVRETRQMEDIRDALATGIYLDNTAVSPCFFVGYISPDGFTSGFGSSHDSFTAPLTEFRYRYTVRLQCMPGLPQLGQPDVRKPAVEVRRSIEQKSYGSWGLSHHGTIMHVGWYGESFPDITDGIQFTERDGQMGESMQVPGYTAQEVTVTLSP